jgi:hypothetical protein
MSANLPRVSWILAVCLLVVGAGWMAGCGGAKISTGGAAAGLTGEDLAQAQRLYAQLVREHQLHRDRQRGV